MVGVPKDAVGNATLELRNIRAIEVSAGNLQGSTIRNPRTVRPVSMIAISTANNCGADPLKDY
eukprot:7736321-Heterocapsa_arctica.AAC.1